MEFYQSRKVGTLGSPVISFALVAIEVSAKSRHSSKFTKMIYLCFEWAVLIREMWGFFSLKVLSVFFDPTIKL